MTKKIFFGVLAILLGIGIYFISYSIKMSNEVLDAFDTINKRLEESNKIVETENNDLKNSYYELLDERAKLKIQEVDSISNYLNHFIEDIKQDIISDLKDPKDYKAMASESELLFKNNSERGLQLVNEIDIYREQLTSTLGRRKSEIKSIINQKFSTSPIENREGKMYDWLEYNFKDFPSIVVLTKLTQIQSDIKYMKSEILRAFIQNQ